MSGYSDRISHALAFAAKHLTQAGPADRPLGQLAAPANVALILARYDCEPDTIAAGILQSVLQGAPSARRADLERRIGRNFGRSVLSIALAAEHPARDRWADADDWRRQREARAGHLLTADEPVVEVFLAGEIHGCGSAVAALRRLGPEYGRTVVGSSPVQAAWWCRCLLEHLERRHDWPRRAMLTEFRELTAELVERLRGSETTREDPA